MITGIICAGDEELAPFLPLLENHRTSRKAKLEIHEGRIGGMDVVALFSGVCKVNAAIAAQLLIDTFSVTAIINPGTAGAIDEKLNIFDTVIGTDICYHDVAPDILTEFHPWMESVFFHSDENLIKLTKVAARRINAEEKTFWGRMVTGESFIADEGRERIKREFSPLSVDMESGSIAHVCYANGIPFIPIRCITDTPKLRGIGNFEKNCAKASEIAKDMTIQLLAEMENQSLPSSLS